MKVTTDSARAVAAQSMVLELLLSDMPEKEYTRDNEVDQWAAKMKLGKPRFESRKQPKQDISHQAIAAARALQDDEEPWDRLYERLTALRR